MHIVLIMSYYSARNVIMIVTNHIMDNIKH